MPIPATIRRPAGPAPLADAHSPLPPGPENRARILALLLGVSLGIALLPAILLSLLAALVSPRRRPVQGLWYLSPATQEGIAALSPRGQRSVRRLLAIIGWAMAGCRNRGMRPRARIHGGTTPENRPLCGPRAPPCPA